MPNEAPSFEPVNDARKRASISANSLNAFATIRSDKTAQYPGHTGDYGSEAIAMKMLKTGLLVALAGGAMLTATAASAQDWRYDAYRAHQAARGPRSMPGRRGATSGRRIRPPIMAIIARPTPMPMPPPFVATKRDVMHVSRGPSAMPRAGITGGAIEPDPNMKGPVRADRTGPFMGSTNGRSAVVVGTQILVARGRRRSGAAPRPRPAGCRHRPPRPRRRSGRAAGC